MNIDQLAEPYIATQGCGCGAGHYSCPSASLVHRADTNHTQVEWTGTIGWHLHSLAEWVSG